MRRGKRRGRSRPLPGEPRALSNPWVHIEYGRGSDLDPGSAGKDHGWTLGRAVPRVHVTLFRRSPYRPTICSGRGGTAAWGRPGAFESSSADLLCLRRPAGCDSRPRARILNDRRAKDLRAATAVSVALGAIGNVLQIKATLTGPSPSVDVVVVDQPVVVQVIDADGAVVKH